MYDDMYMYSTSVRTVQTWEGSSCLTACNHICVISCTKEPSVMTMIADILPKYGFTNQKNVMLLKGGTILF